MFFFSSCILITSISQHVSVYCWYQQNTAKVFNSVWDLGLCGVGVALGGYAALRPPLFFTHVYTHPPTICPSTNWKSMGTPPPWGIRIAGRRGCEWGVGGGGGIKGWHFAALCQWLQTNNGDDDGGSCWRINRDVLCVCVFVHTHVCGHPRACVTTGQESGRSGWIREPLFAIIMHLICAHQTLPRLSADSPLVNLPPAVPVPRSQAAQQLADWRGWWRVWVCVYVWGGFRLCNAALTAWSFSVVLVVALVVFN